LGKIQNDGVKKILALALLKARVLFVDDVELALAADDFAIGATLFDGGANFHGACVKNETGEALTCNGR